MLQQDFGTAYSPERARPQLRGEREPNDAFFADARDVFLHGLLGERRAGTCSSLPVLYMAVARRLGYPVQLASAKGHFYVRYEEGDGHLNVEATSLGFNAYPDEHYRQWPLPTSDAEAARYGLLRPLNAREVLGAFLTIRANCLTSQKRFREAAEAWAEAAAQLPDTPALQGIVVRAHARAGHEAAANRWDALWDGVAGLEIPAGAAARRFRERQHQVQWFMNQSTNLAEIESAIADLHRELAAHRRQVMLESDGPAHVALASPQGTVLAPAAPEESPFAAEPVRLRIAAERVPPEYRQSIPEPLQARLQGLSTEAEVVTEMWKFYAEQLNLANQTAAATLGGKAHLPRAEPDRPAGLPPRGGDQTGALYPARHSLHVQPIRVPSSTAIGGVHAPVPPLGVPPAGPQVSRLPESHISIEIIPRKPNF